MIIDNKFGKTIGIDLAKVEKMNKDDIKETYNKEKKRFLTEIAKFEQQTGKTYENICRVVKHLENYEYDCRVAIFMLLGVRYSDCSGFWGDKYHWPFTVTKDGKTTTWCNAFQNAIQLYDFQKTLDLKVSKDERLTRFGYQRLQNIEEKLIKKIEIEQKQEDKLAAKIDKKGVNAAKEDIEDYEFLLNATTSRKENWILEDILLGNSLSFTIYHWMNAMSRKAKINFDIYVGLIRVFSSLKCFQLRNIIADGVLRVIFAENDFSEKNIKKITDEVKAITDMVNQYYKAFLAFKWRKNIGRSFLKDRADRMRFMDTEANSIGCYIEDGNPGSYLVERSISTINGIYKAELEDDIKKYYNAEYDYEGDRDLLILDSLVLLANKDITVAEKKEHISDEECKTIKDGEEDKRVTAGTKNIMADAPTLFTYIHWEVMKSNDK